MGRHGAGTAAALFKHVRLGNWKAARLWTSHVTRMATLLLRNLVTGCRPLGARYAYAFLWGTACSLRYRIDKSHRICPTLGVNDSERPDDGVVRSAMGETSVSPRPVRKIVQNFTFMFVTQGFTWARSYCRIGPRLLTVAEVGYL